jgi:uncharacterized protein (DUF58 family)
MRIAAFVLACIPVLDLGYLFLVSRFLRIRRRDVLLRGHRGIAFDVELIMENRSILPLLGAVLRDATGTIDADGKNRMVVSLAPRERRVITYRITARERGEFELGPATVIVRDLFGLSRRRLGSSERCRLIVYPRIDRLPFVPRNGVPQGSISSHNPIHEDLTRYRSIRSYLPGDEMKRINWKASARLGALATNEYENTLSVPLVILLDLSLDDYSLKWRYGSVEEAIAVAASLAVAASASGQAVGLVSTGKTKGSERALTIECGSETIVPILEALALVEPTPGKAGMTFAEIAAALPFRSRVAYVGASPGEAAAAFAAAVHARSGDLRLYISDLTRDEELALTRLGIETVPIEDASRE